MNEAHGVLVAVTGVVAVRLSVTGAYLSYLKAGMRWPLFAAGVVLTVLGGITILRSLRAPDEHDDDAVVGHEGHGHGPGGPRVGWLLVLPLLAILLVAPAPLGAYAAARDQSRVPEVDDSGFGALPPPTGGALDLTLTHFVQRAYYDEDSTMAEPPSGTPAGIVGGAALSATSTVQIEQPTNPYE